MAGFAVVLAVLDAAPVKTSLTKASAHTRYVGLVDSPIAVWSRLSIAALAERAPAVGLSPDRRQANAAYSSIAKRHALADPIPVKTIAISPPKQTPQASTATPETPAMNGSPAIESAPAIPRSEAATAEPKRESTKLASVDPGDLSRITPPEPPPVTLPSVIAVLPRPAPPQSPAERLGLSGKSRAHAEGCLARAIYFEARNQPLRGQIAVAQVVMNRVFSGIYPRDVCGVIYQNASHHYACQFTFACDGKSDVPRERRPWMRARRIARDTLDGKLYVRAVGTATHYHAAYVHPRWARRMHRYAREGAHLFYRPTAWGNGDDEPIWSRDQRPPKHRPKRPR